MPETLLGAGWGSGHDPSTVTTLLAGVAVLVLVSFPRSAEADVNAPPEDVLEWKYDSNFVAAFWRRRCLCCCCRTA